MACSNYTIPYPPASVLRSLSPTWLLLLVQNEVTGLILNRNIYFRKTASKACFLQELHLLEQNIRKKEVEFRSTLCNPELAVTLEK